MNYQKYVNIFVGGEASQLVDDLVLQVKLLIALSLLAQHELEIVNAYALDIVCIYGMFKGLENDIYVCGSVEVQEMQRILREFT